MNDPKSLTVESRELEMPSLSFGSSLLSLARDTLFGLRQTRLIPFAWSASYWYDFSLKFKNVDIFHQIIQY